MAVNYPRRLSKILAITFLFLVIGTPHTHAQLTSANQVKAAFLLNFARFVTWPVTAQRSDGSFNVCAFDTTWITVLSSTVQGETIAGRPMRVMRIDDFPSTTSCHLVFIDQMQAVRGPDLLPMLRAVPVLTVGEDSKFLQWGGIIRFVTRANRVQFEINPDAADRAGLKINARLLRLAAIVRVQVEERAP